MRRESSRARSARPFAGVLEANARVRCAVTMICNALSFNRCVHMNVIHVGVLFALNAASGWWVILTPLGVGCRRRGRPSPHSDFSFHRMPGPLLPFALRAAMQCNYYSNTDSLGGAQASQPRRTGPACRMFAFCVFAAVGEKAAYVLGSLMWANVGLIV